MPFFNSKEGYKPEDPDFAKIARLVERVENNEDVRDARDAKQRLADYISELKFTLAGSCALAIRGLQVGTEGRELQEALINNYTDTSQIDMGALERLLEFDKFKNLANKRIVVGLLKPIIEAHESNLKKLEDVVAESAFARRVERAAGYKELNELLKEIPSEPKSYRYQLTFFNSGNVARERAISNFFNFLATFLTKNFKGDVSSQEADGFKEILRQVTNLALKRDISTDMGELRGKLQQYEVLPAISQFIKDRPDLAQEIVKKDAGQQITEEEFLDELIPSPPPSYTPN